MLDIDAGVSGEQLVDPRRWWAPRTGSKGTAAAIPTAIVVDRQVARDRAEPGGRLFGRGELRRPRGARPPQAAQRVGVRRLEHVLDLGGGQAAAGPRSQPAEMLRVLGG